MLYIFARCLKFIAQVLLLFDECVRRYFTIWCILVCGLHQILNDNLIFWKLDIKMSQSNGENDFHTSFFLV